MKNQHGVVKDERGQEQPSDKKRARQDGIKEQREAAEQERHQEAPGEPAQGE